MAAVLVLTLSVTVLAAGTVHQVTNATNDPYGGCPAGAGTGRNYVRSEVEGDAQFHFRVCCFRPEADCPWPIRKGAGPPDRPLAIARRRATVPRLRKCPGSTRPRWGRYRAPSPTCGTGGRRIRRPWRRAGPCPA